MPELAIAAVMGGLRGDAVLMRESTLLMATVLETTPSTGAPSSKFELRAWKDMLAGYRRPSDARGILELAITAVPFVVLWVLMWVTLGLGYWLSLAARHSDRRSAGETVHDPA